MQEPRTGSSAKQSRGHCCINRLRDHETVNLPADVHSADVTRARKGQTACLAVTERARTRDFPVE